MEQIDVKILDKDYRLAVSAEDKPRLVEAAALVDEKMRLVRDAGRISGLDRIAVMAALQLANELLGASEKGEGSIDAVRRIRRMSDAIEAELVRQERLF